MLLRLYSDAKSRTRSRLHVFARGLHPLSRGVTYFGRSVPEFWKRGRRLRGEGLVTGFGPTPTPGPGALILNLSPASIMTAKALFPNHVTCSGSLWEGPNSSHCHCHLQRANFSMLSFVPGVFLRKQPAIIYWLIT